MELRSESGWRYTFEDIGIYRRYLNDGAGVIGKIIPNLKKLQSFV